MCEMTSLPPWLSEHLADDEIAPNVFIKFDGNNWITVDNNGFLLSIISYHEQPMGATWYMYVGPSLASRARLLSAKTIFPSTMTKVLILSPSPNELEETISRSPQIIDISDVHGLYIEEMRKKFPKSITNSYICNLSTDDPLCASEKYDFVLCLMVFNYLEHPDIALNKIINTLSPSGHLLIGIHVMNRRSIKEHKEDENEVSYLTWDTQVGMHCSLRGENWIWSQKGFTKMFKKITNITVTQIHRDKKQLFILLKKELKVF